MTFSIVARSAGDAGPVAQRQVGVVGPDGDGATFTGRAIDPLVLDQLRGHYRSSRSSGRVEG